MVLSLDGFTSYYRTLGAYWTDNQFLQVYGEYNTVFTENDGKPENLTAVEVGAYSVVLSWNETGTATSWVLEVTNNDEEETTYVDAPTNPYTLTGLNAETEYFVRVRPAGDNTLWSDGIYFDTYFVAPTGVAASDVTTTSATISWTGDADSYNLRYAESPLTFIEDFENGLDAQGWTVIRNGEGSANTDWRVVNAETVFNNPLTNHSGSAAVITRSWANNAYNVDNWLISPKVTLDGTLKYWVMDDGSYHEHYDIYVSTTGTDIADFTLFYEPGNATGTWKEVSVDLSSFAGQKGYIAFRHTDNDQDFLFIDDVSIVSNATVEWVTVNNVTAPYKVNGLSPDKIYNIEVQAVYADGKSDWISAHFTTLSDNPIPENITADLAADGATLTWEGKGDSYNVRYRTASTQTTELEADFDEGLDAWTIVTAGEGPGWVIGTELGINAATAYSWKENASYDADNWLISPAVELGGVLKFSVATHPSYPDSYEVLLSTTGTDIADFTTTLQAMATATDGAYTIDLSAYSGTGHIAIHHVSNDCYLLAVYEFAVYGANVPAGEWQQTAAEGATATISGLATNNLYEYQVQSVKGSNISEWSEAGEFALLTLDGNTNNTGNIKKFQNKLAHVTLADRTLYKDGSWNTLCLPFAVTLADSPLAGATAKTLADATMTGTTVSMTFGEAVTQLKANVPYIIKWEENEPLVAPTFSNAVIYYNDAARTIKKADGNVKFIGYYDAFDITAADDDIYYMTADNKLQRTAKDRTLEAFRAYFQFSEAAAGARQFVLNFGDESSATTGINDIQTTQKSGQWYTIDGVKRNVEPARKGLYIKDGRKVVVK